MLVTIWVKCFDSHRVIFRSSGVDPDIQTFTALWDPQRLQNKRHALYIKMKHQCLWYIDILDRDRKRC